MLPNPVSATLPPQPQQVAPLTVETQRLQPSQPPQRPLQFQSQPPLQPQPPPQVQEPQRPSQTQPPPRAQEPRPPRQTQSSPRVQEPPRPRQTQPSRSPVLISEPAPQEQRRRKSRSRQAITSPFSDCIDSFGRSFSLKRFSRPLDGRVNGYIKFSWPQKGDGGKPTATVIEVTDLDHDGDSSGFETVTSQHSYALSVQRRVSASPTTSTATLMSGGDSPFSTASTLALSHHDTLLSPTGSFTQYLESEATENPRFVPPHFGHYTKMDSMDRKLFKFCESSF